METVLVLLSSYNGEKYLREQLDSILTQQGCRVEVMIRDDGSSDQTCSILKEYEQRFGSFKATARILPVLYGEHIGVLQSFFVLLQTAATLEYDYYALADQDDIWWNEKVGTAVAWLKREENEREKEVPLLYACAVQPIDTTGKRIDRKSSYPRLSPSFGNALVENVCTGCTCVFNPALLSLIRNNTPTFAVMHDFWMYLVASAFGNVLYDPKPHLFYRQHDKNTVGMATSRLESYKRRIKNFKKHRGQLSKQAEEFFRLYGGQLTVQDRKLLSDFKQQNARLFFEKTLYRQKKSDTVILKFLLLFRCL